MNFLKLKIFPTNFFLIGISGLYMTPFVLGNHCHSCFLTLPILKNDKLWLSLSLLNKDNQLQKDLLINVNVNDNAYASELCPSSITIDNLN